jgi:thiol-disulfide isomerase/thioredoxin
MVILAARLVLAAVFAAAGVAKLLDRKGSGKSLAEFGVPKGLAPALGVVLPVVELACAVALVVDSWAWWGACGVAVLLVVFIAAIGVSLARGRRPDCHCFGQLSSSPVSGRTVARNAVLLALAGVVVAQGQDYVGEWPSLDGWSSFELAVLVAGVALAAVVAVMGWVLLHMLKQNGRLLVRLEAIEKKVGVDPNAPVVAGLTVGSAAPDFQLPGAEGGTMTLETLHEPGKPVMLVFTETGCGACEALKPEIARWQSEHADRLTVAAVSGSGITGAYQVKATPSAVLIAAGKISTALAEGPDAIRDLVARSTLPAPVKKGEVVPALQLPDLDGRTLDLGALRGRRTLVLFWSPSCGYCQQMLEDVKKLERERAADAPELLIISSGTAEANREQGFRSPVLLDRIFGAGSVLGAGGTPSAVIIDEQGVVASEVGVGAPAVLALAANGQPS